MGRYPAHAIDVPQRHPFCAALTYPEWDRLVKKIGVKDCVDLGFRVSERDRMLRAGKKSVPKHRINEKGLGWP